MFVHNNIIEDLTNRPVVVIAPDAMTNYATLHITHNMDSDPAGVMFEWDDKNLCGINITTWRQDVGLDKQSIVANPLFASTTSLTLSANSPAVNAGVPLASVQHDFDGVATPARETYEMGSLSRSSKAGLLQAPKDPGPSRGLCSEATKRDSGLPFAAAAVARRDSPRILTAASG